MKKTILLAMLFYCLPFFSLAQTFPEKCEGKWEGNMEIFNQTIKITEVKIKLTVNRIDSLSWTWKTEYLSKTLPVTKDYILRVKNEQKGEYLVDEGDGIMLKEQLFGNKMVSVLEVNNILITSSYEIVGDKLIFEVISGRRTNDHSTNVVSLEMKNLQKAILSKSK